MHSSKRLNAWQNDIGNGDDAKQNMEKQKTKRQKGGTSEIDVDMRVVDGPSLDKVSFDESSDGDDDDDYQELPTQDEDGVVCNGVITQTTGVEMSDLDYMRSKMSSTRWEEDEDEDEETIGRGVEGREESLENGDWVQGEDQCDSARRGAHPATVSRGRSRSDKSEAGGGDEEGLAEHGRLFIRNLPYETSEDSLKVLFSSYGPLSEVHIPIDKNTRRGKGTAYVQVRPPRISSLLSPSSDHYATLPDSERAFQGRSK